MNEIQRKLFKGITAVKGLDTERIKELVIAEKDPSLTSIPRILKKYRGEETMGETLKTENFILSFETVSDKVGMAIKAKGKTYRAKSLLELLNQPQYFSFIAGTQPLRYHQGVISIIPELTRKLIEEGGV